MSKSFFLSLRSPDALKKISETNKEPISSGIRIALERLRIHGEFCGRLEEYVSETDGPEAVSIFQSILERLSRKGLLLRSVYAESELLATQVPLVPDFASEEKSIYGDRRYILSRFAYTRREQDAILLESPLSFSRIILYHRIAAIVFHSLSQPISLHELLASIPELAEKSAKDLMDLLFSSNIVCEVNEQGSWAEEERSDLRCWEFHDLLFHTRSRAGRHDHPAGGTYRFNTRLDPPVKAKKITGLRSIPLFRPDLQILQQTDPPFARVQEERCSIRSYAKQSISERQLGEFLYRVARISGTEIAKRPYPSGGAIYEQELYPVIQRCENLEHGFYYYDAQNHSLIQISGITPAVERSILEASRAAAIPQAEVQVLLLISARFQQVAWKYSTMAYALMLKNVGVLYQTMYLVATAMGLAPCALGYGDSDLFAQAARTDYYAETSIGEFLLGSKP